MTTDLKINEILKDVKGFKGVFLYDAINQLHSLQDSVIVVNYVTKAEALQGIVGHYVVIDTRNIIKGNNIITPFFFDPYGLEPDIPRDLLHLPNTGNITKFLERIGKTSSTRVTVNRVDFQVEKPWDDLCGVYSSLYVENPNFQTNPALSLVAHKSRVKLDHKLIKLFTDVKFLGNPYSIPDILKTRKLLSST